MYRILLLTCILLPLSACSQHARNSEYSGALRRATRGMLSVDFVDLIVEQEDEHKEDYVVFSKEEALLCEQEQRAVTTSTKKRKPFHVTKNESGEWIYIQDR